MKKTILVFGVALLCFSGLVAENAKKQIVTRVFDTDIRCEGCSTKVMNNVAALGKGVKDVKVDVPTKQITVTYDATKTNDAKIISGFKTIAVTAKPAKK